MTSSNSDSAWCSKRLFASIGVAERGGSTITVADDNEIIIFGGADREQTAFNDAIRCRKSTYVAGNGGNTTAKASSSVWEVVKSLGDVPPPRSGHAMISYGRLILLYGGIDFKEEVAYNDLYTYDIDTCIWQYVGEAGEEITVRNSHSLAIIYPTNDVHKRFLVVYGGASPEHGVVSDTYYASIPEPADIIQQGDKFFVTWMKMNPVVVASTSAGHACGYPVGREMHSSCMLPDGSLLVCGGRDAQGTILADAWQLVVTTGSETDTSTDINVDEVAGFANAYIVDATDSTPGRLITIIDATGSTFTPPPTATTNASNAARIDGVSLRWIKRIDLKLPFPRCSHGAAVVSQTELSPLQSSEGSSTSSKHVYLCIYGGFTGTAINKTLSTLLLESCTTTTTSITTTVTTSSTTTSSSSIDTVILNDALINIKDGTISTSTAHTSEPITTSTTETSTTIDSITAVWKEEVLSQEIGARFGFSMCTSPIWIQPSGAATAENRNCDGLLLFGGVDADNAYCDIWYLSLQR